MEALPVMVRGALKFHAYGGNVSQSLTYIPNTMYIVAFFTVKR